MKLSEVLTRCLVTPAYLTTIVGFNIHLDEIEIQWEDEGLEYRVTCEDQDVVPSAIAGMFDITDVDDETVTFLAYSEFNFTPV